MDYANDIWHIRPHPLDIQHKRSHTLVEARNTDTQ